jgi:hypothetical protein
LSGYRLSPSVRNVLIRHLEEWLNSDRPVFALYVDKLTGRGSAKNQIQVGEITGEILEEATSAETLIDEIVDSYSSYGRKLQLRIVFADDDGTPSSTGVRTKQFQMVPETPGTRTGSRGPDAATERLSLSLSQGFDTMIRRQDDSQQRTLEVLRGNSGQMERFFERLLELQAQGSNATTTQAIALQQQVSRAELAEFKLQIMAENQDYSLGALIIEALPTLLTSDLVSNLSSLAGAAASRMSAEAGSTPNPPQELPASPDSSGANGLTPDTAGTPN